MATGNLKIFSGCSNPGLVSEISEFLGINALEAMVTCFPDGESCVSINENVRGEDVFVVQSTCNPPNHNIMELLIMIDSLKRASANRITAVLPFFGYARQDRKDKPRVPITAKLVANLLVAAGANRILTMDLHSPQITGFFDIPVDHLMAAPVFYNYLEKYKSDNLIIVSPDIGGMKMASVYSDLLNCPIGVVTKRRMDAENVETMYTVGEVDGKDAILVDDMTESGGTLVSAAKALKESGAKSVRAVVTHGVLNQRGYERLAEGQLDELITTNTTPVKVDKDSRITVLSVANLIGEAILRIHHDQSVSSLFKIKGY